MTGKLKLIFCYFVKKKIYFNYSFVYITSIDIYGFEFEILNKKKYSYDVK